MLELTLEGDIGFTERIFIAKIAVLSVVSDYPKYHSIIGILQITNYFGMQKYLRHHLYLQITVYVGSPKNIKASRNISNIIYLGSKNINRALYHIFIIVYLDSAHQSRVIHYHQLCSGIK